MGETDHARTVSDFAGHGGVGHCPSGQRPKIGCRGSSSIVTGAAVCRVKRAATAELADRDPCGSAALGHVDIGRQCATPKSPQVDGNRLVRGCPQRVRHALRRLELTAMPLPVIKAQSVAIIAFTPGQRQAGA